MATAKTKILPGRPDPLGAHWDGHGVNFAVYSAHARAVYVCLYADDGQRETARLKLPEATNQIWHGYVPDLRPGQLYGLRVSGPFEPHAGHRFNPNKLLLDPYARAIAGTIDWQAGDALFGYVVGSPEADLSYDKRDSAAYVPKCVVVDPAFEWEDDAPPRTPWSDTVIYEVHVKGLTARHPRLPPEVRGTFAGLTCGPVLDHLRSLGITAVELLPPQQFLADRHLAEKGLTNYWGYSTIGFFAPDARYASAGVGGQQVNEFKQMVKALHRAGLEVLLDVVYNHTGEGQQLGPTVAFRGIDNAAYYRLADDRRFYMDYTGTGNTLDLRQPHVLRLIMDSLRYWVQEMHVDGFRFDLATTLGREQHGFDAGAAFFDLLYQDPVLSQVKLIAEPWDVGEGGYQVGAFPPGWQEWNGKYRDSVRDLWRGAGALGEFAARFTGSSDLFRHNGRKPTASLNFVTAHDGFTLRDLVSYNEKHNEMNAEENRDGESHNRSWNCGYEGPVDDEAINALRGQQQRNLLTTLFLSQGVPMLLGGDELGRTQQGNNNAYCQDSEISWFDWETVDRDLLDFVQRLITFRRQHPVFRQDEWLRGRPIRGIGLSDIVWFSPDGDEMDERDWHNGQTALAVFLNGMGIKGLDPAGNRITDDSFYLVFNAGAEPANFVLPASDWVTHWEKVWDTTQLAASSQRIDAGEAISVPARAVVVYRHAA